MLLADGPAAGRIVSCEGAYAVVVAGPGDLWQPLPSAVPEFRQVAYQVHRLMLCGYELAIGVSSFPPDEVALFDLIASDAAKVVAVPAAQARPAPDWETGPDAMAWRAAGRPEVPW